MKVRDILRCVADGTLDLPAAEKKLTSLRDEMDMGFARLDLQRPWRCGMPEAIFGEGKTPDQIAAAMRALHEAGQPALATRVNLDQADWIRDRLPDAVYHARARIVTLSHPSAPDPVGRVAVVWAGTSDLPVAEEAALTAEWMGAEVARVPDVGVAGLHRLTRRLDELQAANALVIIAGMEGALPSVVGGLLDRPIIAVPTSVGYGLNLEGLSTLLAMLNSCVPGVAVVNIDNGFGAGVAAARINRLIAGAGSGSRGRPRRALRNDPARN